MIYFDTSYVVRLYFRDVGFADVRKLAASDQIACAWHGQPEALGAFHRKLREKTVSRSGYAALLDQFERDQMHKAILWLPQGQSAYERLALVYRTLPASVFLRAADALHLAVAAEAGFREIYSNDAHLLAAAGHFGLVGKNVF